MNYVILLSLVLAVALYWWSVRRYEERARRFSRWHVAAFGATIGLLYLALEPPLELLADDSFLAHMAQHMLLVYVVAPLFLLSAPMTLLLGSLGPTRARRLGRFLRGPLWRALTFPVFTWLFFMAVMWGSHFSALYESSLENPAIHIGEHALFLVAAVLFWQTIVHVGPVSWPMNFPLRIVYVFLAMPQGAFLGLALYQTGTTLYPHYVSTHGGSAAAALEDQHAGGALMWIGGGLLLFVIFMAMVAMWGRYERRLGERLDSRRDGRARSANAFVTAFALAILGLDARAAATTLDQGQALYQIHCSSCHGMSLQGSPIAPSLREVSIDAVQFYLTTGRMPALVPSEQNQHRTPIFSPGQIDSIVAFVMSHSRGSTILPYVDNQGNLARGRALFMANCSACHGATAQGGSVGYGWIAPSLDRATVTQVAQAIRVGPGVMPRFDEATLTDRDVNDIVRYVNVLQTDVPNPGGFALGGLGPFAEGLVAWVLGLGSLVVVIRLIGSNA
jgi:ubiquinol-cytochrome c reductase cytochrome c subunit